MVEVFVAEMYLGEFAVDFPGNRTFINVALRFLEGSGLLAFYLTRTPPRQDLPPGPELDEI